MRVAVTGHRPDKLGGYTTLVYNRLTECAMRELEREQPAVVLTGMALGWDMAVASACINLRLPYIACLPLKNQAAKWTPHWRGRWQLLVKHAIEVVDVDELQNGVQAGPYAPWKLQRRNQYMVDNCDRLLALWNGTDGGTANCVGYASGKGVEIVNCWDRWLALSRRKGG